MSDYASSSSRPVSPVGELPALPNAAARSYRFTWDGAHNRGPGSVSESTEGRGGEYLGLGPMVGPYGEVHTPSSANLALTGIPNVGGVGADWTSSVHGFHAISTVLNNPHKKQAPPKAHSALPAVPPADLPRVRRKDFDAYLKSVAPEWDNFVRNAEQGREGAARLGGAGSAPADETDEPRTPRPGQLKALPPLDSVPSLYFDRDFSLGDARTFAAVLQQDAAASTFSTLSETLDPATYQPPLDTLPAHLDTIEQHLIREISVRSHSFFAALANLQDLQSESAGCLTRIAALRGLLKQVDEGTAKKGLGVVVLEERKRNLGKVRQAIGEVAAVQEMVGIAKGLVAAGQWGEALDVVEELERLWHAGAYSGEDELRTPTASTVKKGEDGRRSPLPTVAEDETEVPSTPESHSHTSSSPWTPLSRSPLANQKQLPNPSESSPSTPTRPSLSIPLSSLSAFSSLPAQLRALTGQIASSLSTELVSVLRVDLLDRIDRAVQEGQKPRELQMSFEDRLRPLLHALNRTGAVQDAAKQWREVACTEVRGILRQNIPSFDLGDETDLASAPSTDTVRAIRALDHSIFLERAQTMYKAFLASIEGIQSQNTAILEIVDAVTQSRPTLRSPSNSATSSNSQSTALIPVLQETLSTAAELANACAARVLTVRSEEHAKLELREFYELFTKTWDFVVRSEVLSRRMIVGLRGAIVGQSKAFLQSFHQSRLNASAKLVEDEQWNPAEVSPTVQSIVNLVVDASIRDPAEFMFDPPPQPEGAEPEPASPQPPPKSPGLGVNGSSMQPSSPVPSPMLPHQTPAHLSPNTSGSPSSKRRSTSHAPGKHLHIEGRHFFAVSATLEVLVLLADYLKVIINLETLTPDTVSRTIELLKAFNSRTCQVVLGAGAMRSAGLKNITAKHLALASQSLSIMISLIPYVRETFRRHLSPKQAVMLIEFDKLKRDYQEHQNEIHAKLIAIMGDRLSAHIKSLQAVKWDVPKEGGGVNDYMELLVKETVTLHKVLSRYLSVSVVEYVMTQVFAAINHRLSEEYAAIDLPSLEAKERLLADAKYLHEKLSSLKNVRAPTAMLEIVVNEKRVAPPAPKTPAPGTPGTPSVNNGTEQPRSAAHSRFATMFSRMDTLKAKAASPATAAPPQNLPQATPGPGTPQSESEKALAAASPSPEPHAFSPVPTPDHPLASSPSPQPNGHSSALYKSENASGSRTFLSPQPNGFVEEPLGIDGSENSEGPPLPPKSPTFAPRSPSLTPHSPILPPRSPSLPLPGSRPGSRAGSRPHSPLPRPEPIPLPEPDDTDME